MPSGNNSSKSDKTASTSSRKPLPSSRRSTANRVSSASSAQRQYSSPARPLRAIAPKPSPPSAQPPTDDSVADKPSQQEFTLIWPAEEGRACRPHQNQPCRSSPPPHTIAPQPDPPASERRLSADQSSKNETTAQDERAIVRPSERLAQRQGPHPGSSQPRFAHQATVKQVCMGALDDSTAWSNQSPATIAPSLLMLTPERKGGEFRIAAEEATPSPSPVRQPSRSRRTPGAVRGRPIYQQVDWRSCRALRPLAPKPSPPSSPQQQSAKPASSPDSAPADPTPLPDSSQVEVPVPGPCLYPSQVEMQAPIPLPNRSQVKVPSPTNHPYPSQFVFSLPPPLLFPSQIAVPVPFPSPAPTAPLSSTISPLARTVSHLRVQSATPVHPFWSPSAVELVPCDEEGTIREAYKRERIVEVEALRAGGAVSPPYWTVRHIQEVCADVHRMSRAARAGFGDLHKQLRELYALHTHLAGLHPPPWARPDDTVTVVRGGVTTVLLRVLRDFILGMSEHLLAQWRPFDRARPEWNVNSEMSFLEDFSCLLRFHNKFYGQQVILMHAPLAPGWADQGGLRFYRSIPFRGYQERRDTGLTNAERERDSFADCFWDT
ncbi:hypothetical protein CRV24_006628 [Beauveria bassiana]|nr:hypothetical protein CRV24_006628 [Beauveria bassiana]